MPTRRNGPVSFYVRHHKLNTAAMSTLREKTKNRFIEILDRCYFSAANFKIDYPEGEDVETIIEFIPRPDFQFTVMRHASTKYKTLECPTEHLLSQDSFIREDLDECILALGQWTERIEEEYRSAHPMLDEFESFRTSMEAKFRAHVEDEHAHFTKEQAESLRTRLDELAAELATLSDRTSEGEQKLSEANNEIEKLKADIETLPRGIWFRKAGAKTISMLKAVATSKETREFALTAAKKWLLEGPK